MLERSGLFREKIVDIFLQPWVFSNNIVQQFFVFDELRFQVSDVSQINIALKSVDVHAPREAELIVAEKKVDF